MVGRCDAGHQTDLADLIPIGRSANEPRDSVNVPRAEPRPGTTHPRYRSVAAHLDGIAGFVDIYAKLDPHDESREDRGRLIEVECLVSQALDRFSLAADIDGVGADAVDRGGERCVLRQILEVAEGDEVGRASSVRRNVAEGPRRSRIGEDG